MLGTACNNAWEQQQDGSPRPAKRACGSRPVGQADEALRASGHVGEALRASGHVGEALRASTGESAVRIMV